MRSKSITYRWRMATAYESKKKPYNYFAFQARLDRFYVIVAGVPRVYSHLALLFFIYALAPAYQLLYHGK